MEYPYFFTIFIPTYNRADLLPRAFRSIERQGFKDFEVLIVDDGSTDNTREVVYQWKSRVGFPVRYFRQENLGKPAAYNSALEKLRGFFTVVLDSDDILAPGALEILKNYWDDIPDDQKPHFAGVEGLCSYLDDTRISGKRFPEDVMDRNFLEMQYRYGIWGDKKGAARTEILRQYPFPIFPNEKDMRESVIWNRMAHLYKFRYINQVIQKIEQLPDGLTANAFRRRIGSPRGFRLAFLEMLNEHAMYCSPSQQLAYARRYVRCSLHCGCGYIRQWSDVKKRWYWLLAVPEGTIGWLKDWIKMWRYAEFRKP